MRRVRVTAAGLVQGVFFRASLQREATARGVTGWVRNTDDGRVEAELQGSPADVDAMVELCRRGPGQAEVETLDVEEIAVDDAEESFEVR